jgi:hypothetical protein
MCTLDRYLFTQMNNVSSIFSRRLYSPFMYIMTRKWPLAKAVYIEHQNLITSQHPPQSIIIGLCVYTSVFSIWLTTRRPSKCHENFVHLKNFIANDLEDVVEISLRLVPILCLLTLFLREGFFLRNEQCSYFSHSFRYVGERQKSLHQCNIDMVHPGYNF